ncbi:class E sortase [Haloechinothrix sp. LS1_15]|uniref:class E sortase n=1 Tax=Haloechinothrix sp. LS1_15 TaxID=2652248 RepID=UPI002946EE31|nr:class E sortase [Haloechinothrix sp. LS1_15]MDV6010914.1 class E sortase [Haloechinothrix sp. LS1_15]
MSQRQEPGTDGGRGAGYLVVRTFGELLVTAGIVVLLFVFYALYVTNWTSAQLQSESDEALTERWQEDPGPGQGTSVLPGEAFARIYIPALGEDYRYTIQSGVDADALEIGPGHYPQTAQPGEPGNFAVAGHRNGQGAPFNALDELVSCDAMVIETDRDFFVYRVLPLADEVGDWDVVRDGRPECAGVPSLRSVGDNEPYGDTIGRKIVTPDRADAVAPVPYRPQDTLSRIDQAALITLTTCHPQFSDRERLIIHGVLTQQIPKNQVNGDYHRLLDHIGEA